MRIIFRVIGIAAVPAWLCVHAAPALAQTFDDRWSIIPKAHAEPAPAIPNDPQQNQNTPSTGEQGSDERPGNHSQVFSGKASFYSYSAGKTASGSSFDREMPTAAHRSLPFGTKVRVTDLTTHKSVVVEITDRGPHVGDRVLDLSLGAARSLGIEDRGVIRIRAEVL